MAIDLCQRINFRATRVVRNGVGYTGWVSGHRTLVTPRGVEGSGPGMGDCKRICAQLVFNPGRGTMQMQIITEELLAVGGFLNIEGRTQAALRAAVRGTITIWISTQAGVPHLDAAGGIASTPRIPGVNELCEIFDDPINRGWDCIYCQYSANQGDRRPCSIRAPIEKQGCITGGVPSRLDPFLPGARVVGRRGSWDITGDDGAFSAGSGRTGLVRYYLKSFQGAVNPEWPGDKMISPRGVVGSLLPNSIYGWLCAWTIHNTNLRAWELHCVAPIQETRVLHEAGVRKNQRLPRDLQIAFGGPVTFITFQFSFPPWGTYCFQLFDQFCMTGGMDEECGPDYGTCEGWTPCWDHLCAPDSKLTVLDSLLVNLNMRLAPDAGRYPHKEPECLKIANDALAQMGTTIEMFRPNLNSWHAYGFDKWELNLWALDKWFGDCATAPVLRNRSTGAPWSVYIVPYGAGCQAPADLVLLRASFALRLSGDTGNTDFPDLGDSGKLRIAASFFCQVELGVRLKPGWEALSCLVEIRPDGQCGLPTTRPERTVILISDGCSRVPLKIVWRGLCGPRPWSRDHFAYDHPSDCCGLLRGIHQLLIPGEVNDTGNPDGPQRYEGDVITFLRPNSGMRLACGFDT